MSLISQVRPHWAITAAARSLQRDERARDRQLRRATLAFVVLGVVLRIVRYALNYPLWWDESFLAVNLIKRGYLDLLRPLDYSQVCPVLFLWAELSVVKLLGFCEWTLRLLPLFCGIASVLLFHLLAGRIVRGLPLLLAVAIFAVSYHPIRHAADVKPYASDLLAALIVMAAAIEWTRAPSRGRWMWVLAAVSPVLIALSHPAIFVISGVALALAPAVIKAHRQPVVIAYLGFIATFGSNVFRALHDLHPVAGCRDALNHADAMGGCISASR